MNKCTRCKFIIPLRAGWLLVENKKVCNDCLTDDEVSSILLLYTTNERGLVK